MTPNKIKELVNRSRGLDDLIRLVEASTRDECARLVEQDLYPDDAGKPYTQQYNYSIKVLADKIRGMA